jgi:hypothetical protein
MARTEKVEISSVRFLKVGDVVVEEDSEDAYPIVERQLPLPEVKVGDLVRYYWAGGDESAIEEITAVEDEIVHLKGGGFLYRDEDIRVSGCPPHEFFAKRT